MIESFIRNGKRKIIIDLSDRLSNATREFEPNAHKIIYKDHKDSITVTEKYLGLDKSYWPDEEGWAVEEVTLSTHSYTHIDAPYHYGSTSNGKPAKTIEQIPLNWCYGDGVLINMTYKQAGEGISIDDLQEELKRINYSIKPYDIILIYTGTSKHFHQPGYEYLHAGLTASATEWLIDQGVKLIGIDAWGLDRPFNVTAKEAKEGKSQFWEAHIVGRRKEYCQIEKLCNLDKISKPYGFTVCAFPINIANASAGWSRVVAIFDEIN
jgi:kynurenine formamidase